MKKFVLALIFLFLSTLATEHVKPNASANNTLFETPVCLTVNGNYIKTNTSGYLENGYAMLPVRAIAEALTANKIDWNEKSSTVTIATKDATVVLKKNSNTASVNGKTVKMNVAAAIQSDRFYAPARFVAESLNAEVAWDAATYTVNVTAQNVVVPDSVIGDRGYTDGDLYWLSKIVNAESRGEPMNGKIAVANVVLNRVESQLFADNIYDVIFDTNYGVQFTPVINGTVYNTPSGDSIIAAKRALLGENHAGESLYFLNPKIASSFWIINNRVFFKSIGNHDFYL